MRTDKEQLEIILQRKIIAEKSRARKRKIAYSFMSLILCVVITFTILAFRPNTSEEKRGGAQLDAPALDDVGSDKKDEVQSSVSCPDVMDGDEQEVGSDDRDNMYGDNIGEIAGDSDSLTDEDVMPSESVPDEDRAPVEGETWESAPGADDYEENEGGTDWAEKDELLDYSSDAVGPEHSYPDDGSNQEPGQELGNEDSSDDAITEGEYPLISLYSSISALDKAVLDGYYYDYFSINDITDDMSGRLGAAMAWKIYINSEETNYLYHTVVYIADDVIATDYNGNNVFVIEDYKERLLEHYGEQVCYDLGIDSWVHLEDNVYYFAFTAREIRLLAEAGMCCMYIGSGMGHVEDASLNDKEGLEIYCELNGDGYAALTDYSIQYARRTYTVIQ